MGLRSSTMSTGGRTIGRVEHYLQFFNADHSVTIHGSSLDCTFCGKLFPIYYMLSINPYGVDDWRNVHNRCCYQCATCANDDYVWYSERSNLSPAKLRERGHLGDRHFDQLDRSGLYDRDDDRETSRPAGTSRSSTTTPTSPRCTSITSGTPRSADGFGSRRFFERTA